ncbi:hypothetical protein [Nonomuraea sp. NPDC050643]|uniref:hypothetical protein n=1 Tax=Nonomuraea sp. NPDC050643 TaxID=3155660 RepID=UPI0033F379CB
MADTPCWVPSFADGTKAVAMPGAFVAHYPSERAARDGIARINPTAPVAPRQLDQPCVIVTCGGCLDTFDGDSTIHFGSVEEAHAAIGECTEWNRWTVLPDGGYLCDVCTCAAASATQEWVNPTLEEWAEVAPRPPVTPPRMGEAFTPVHADAEEAALGDLAALTVSNDPWTAASLAFAPTGERA